MWLAALTRNAAYLNDDRHSIWGNIEPDIKRAYSQVFPGVGWDRIPPARGLLPTKAEGEAADMKAAEELTRTLRLYARPQGESSFRDTARVAEPIGYGGSNRILAVIEVRDGREYVQDGPNNERYVVFRLHYGQIPPDFFEEWKEDMGHRYVVERAAEPGRVEPALPEPAGEEPGQHPLVKPWMNEEEKAQAGKTASESKTAFPASQKIPSELIDWLLVNSSS